MVVGRSETTASTGLVAMPFELLTRIFEHLGSLELCRCACVAKAWTALALEPRFWRAICLDNLPLAGPDIVSVCRRYPALEALSLRNVALDVRTPGLVFRACPRISALCLAGVRAPCLDLIVHDMTGSLAFLRELDLSGLSLTNAMLRVLERRCAALERLNLSRCTLAPTESTVGGIRMLQLGHAKLRLLQLCGVRVPVTELNCPALESLDLSGESLSDGMLLPMVASSPLLNALSLADCRNVTDAAVKDVLAHSRGLRSLNLSGCTCLTADALREAASAAPRLQTLVMARCPLLGDLATVPLTSARLTSLDLSGCDALRLADVSSPSLRALSLGGCRSLSRLAVDCAALDALVLDGCDGLLELELRTALRSVALPGSCSQLRAASLHNDAVARLSFASFCNLACLELRCPALLSLDLSHCCSLTDASVAGIVASCPKLNHLSLEECERLTDLTLRTAALRSLTLVGCKGLAAVELACPGVRSLALEGCSALGTATLECAAGALDLGTCRQLRELRLSSARCASLSLKGCLRLARAQLSCAALRSLDLSFCADLSDDALLALASDALAELNISRCVKLSNGLLSGLATPFPRLSALHLSYMQIDDETLCALLSTMPELRTLDLAACKRLCFARLHPLLLLPARPAHAPGGDGVGAAEPPGVGPLETPGGAPAAPLPRLESLDVSYTSACSRAVQLLLRLCPELRCLKLNGCLNLSDVHSDLAAPAGAGANAGLGAADAARVSEAPGGGAAGVGEAAPSARADGAAPNALACLSQHRRLRQLSMVGCNRLAGLELRGSETLVDVSVRSCAALRAVRVEGCRALRSLSAFDCAELTAVAVAGCAALDALDLRNCAAGMDVQLGTVAARVLRI